MVRSACPTYLLDILYSATSAVALVAVGLLTAIQSAGAQPRHTDYFSTTGGGAQAKYDQEKNSWERRANMSDNFRTRSKGCLSILDEALVHMRRADELHEQFRQQKIHSDHPDFKIYRESGRESQIAAGLIDKFHKCLRPFMAIMVDDINSGGGSGNGDEFNSSGNNPPATGYYDPFSDRIETGGDKICDMQRIALLIKERYQRPGKPLASYEVKGFDPVMGRPGAKTFLLVAQGVDNKDFWNYWLAQVTRAYSQNSAAPETRAITNISKLVAGESYSRAILKAIESLPIA